MSQKDPQFEEIVSSETDVEVKEPPLYKVMLLNDDYTTMEFVVEVLRYVFNKSAAEATRIMLNVHRKGVGVCGVYPYEVAETKVDAVDALARQNGFPLKCIMEKE
jgi:ATP-dependent Clp protease adaptor protein ClpS